MTATTATPALLAAAAFRAAQVAECAEVDLEFARLSGAHWSQVDHYARWARVAAAAAERAFAACG